MIYIEIRPKGTRLGNWMFQYAAAKSASPQEGITFVIEDRNDWPKVEKFKALFPDVVIADHAPDGAVIRTDLYQDVNYLSPDVVRGLFSCPAEIRHRLDSKYGELLDDKGLVSIHVRRGDYLKLPHRHPFVGKEYLQKAVGQFSTIANVKFMVCSDDMAWCKKFFSNKHFPGVQFYFSEGVGVLDDLYLMRRCKGGHICSNSTFSWWGAYGSASPQPLTFFPSMWYGPAIKCDWQGMYFDGSEIIENGYPIGMYLPVGAHLLKDLACRILRNVGLR